MSAHPADMERAEQLRDELKYAEENKAAAQRKALEAWKDYELARTHHAKALRAYLDFKPVVEGQ